MAAINRYTSLTPSQFNPLSLEEILSTPIYKQNQHDQLQSGADELGLFDVKNLEIDTPIVNDTLTTYRKSLDDYINELNTIGFNATSKGKLRELNRQKQQLLSQTGTLGKAQAAYSSYISNIEDLKKMYQNGKISADKYQKGIANAVNQYKGVAENDTYNPFIAVQDTDYVEKARKIAVDIQKNPVKIEKLLPLKRQNGMFIDTETGQEYTLEDAIKSAVKTALLSDSNVVSDLKQREQLGLFGNYTAQEVIDNLANTLETTYSVNNKSINRDIRTDPYALEDYKQQLKKQEELGNITGEALPEEHIKIRNAELSNELSSILNGDSVNKSIMSALSGASLNPYSGQLYKGAGSEYRKKNLNDLSNEQMKEYISIYEGLNNDVKDLGDPSSPEAMKAVKEYIDTFSDIKYQNNIITEGFTTTYGNNSIGVNKNSPEKVAEYILSNPESRKFYSIKDGKVLSFEEMVDKGYLEKEYKENFNNSIVTGYYDSRNYFSKVIDSQYAGAFVSPYELKVGENRFLVTRSNSEMNTKGYKAEKDFNDLFVKSTTQPKLGHIYRIPGTDYKIKVAGIPEQAEDGTITVNKFVINQLDENGNNTNNSKIVSAKELRNGILNYNGINN